MDEEPEESLDYLSDVIERLRKGTPDGKVFQIVGPRQVSVVEKGAGGLEKYRKRALTGSEEFFFAGAVTSKKNLVFCFTPVDALPFERIELSETEVMQIVAGAQEWISDILGEPLREAKKTARHHMKVMQIEKKRLADIERMNADFYGPNRTWGSW